MPTPRVNMSKLRHALQLLHEATLSTRQIGQALNISKTTVSEIASYARAAGVDWPTAQGLTDEELQRRLLQCLRDYGTLRLCCCCLCEGRRVKHY